MVFDAGVLQSIFEHAEKCANQRSTFRFVITALLAASRRTLFIPKVQRPKSEMLANKLTGTLS
jgi:hypothetical protein